MGSAVSGVLAVDKRVVFLAALVGMGYGHFDVIALEMDGRVERIGGHCVAQEVEQTVTRDVALAVEHHGKAGIEVGVVLDQRHYELIAVGIVAEYACVRSEAHECAVGFGGRLDVALLHLVAAAVEHAFHPPSRTLQMKNSVERALTALMPTPLRPTDFLKALESYLPPVFILDDTSTSFPRGTPRP